MPFKLQRINNPKDFTGREPTYSEIVKVVDGVAICQKKNSCTTLIARGYRLLEVIDPNQTSPEKVTDFPVPPGEPAFRRKAATPKAKAAKKVAVPAVKGKKGKK